MIVARNIVLILQRKSSPTIKLLNFFRIFLNISPTDIHLADTLFLRCRHCFLYCTYCLMVDIPSDVRSERWQCPRKNYSYSCYLPKKQKNKCAKRFSLCAQQFPHHHQAKQSTTTKPNPSCRIKVMISWLLKVYKMP